MKRVPTTRAASSLGTRRIPAYAGQAGMNPAWSGRSVSDAVRPGVWLALLGLLTTALLAMLVARFDVFVVAGLLLALAAVALVIVRPGLAVGVVALVVYLNIPAILTQRFDIPEFVAGGVILLLGVPLVAHCVLRRRRLRGDRAFTLMLVFLGTLLLSSTVAIDKTLALGRVQGYIFEGLLLFWLILNVVRDLPTLRKMMLAFLAAGAIVSALALYQDVSGNYSQDFGGLAYRNYDVTRDGTLDTLGGARTERGRFDRAQGPVNEPNRFAQIMVVLLPMAVYLFRTGSTRVFRTGVAVLGILVFIGVVLTLSRGGIIALGLMAVTMSAVGWIKTSRMAIVVTAALLFVPVVTPFYMDRIASITNVTYLFGNDGSTIREADGAMRGRLTEMLAALYVFFDHPLVGVGPGQFAPYYVQDYSRDPDIQFRDIREARRAHTLYFELAAENGIIGLVSFMAIVLVLVQRLWKARTVLLKRMPAMSDLATACWLSLLSYLCTAVFLHMSYQRYYWLLLATATAALHVVTSEAQRRGVGDSNGF